MFPAALNLPHLNDSIQEIDDSSWLIVNTFLLTRSSSPLPESIPSGHACWSDSRGGHYALSDAPEPFPDSKSLPEDSTSISRVHAVDNQAAVWQAGEAFIKGHHMDYPLATREHVTLQFIKNRQPHGFSFPTVLHHFEAGSRYFVIISKVPGQLLEEVWPNMNENLREHYVRKVADICHHLATWRGDAISGVDGQQLLERYLRGNSKMADALSPQVLLRNCTEMSMNVSTLVFYHCDLGPTNLLVDTSTGSLSIIDWELAGYVPIEWVRTKFRLSAGMDFNHVSNEDRDRKVEWRRRVSQRLETLGYPDAVDAWWKFRAA